MCYNNYSRKLCNLYCFIVPGSSDNHERELVVLLLCSDDGRKQCRRIQKWLINNRFSAVFDDDERKFADMNLIVWAENQVKQARNSVWSCYRILHMVVSQLQVPMYVVVFSNVSTQ